MGRAWRQDFRIAGQEFVGLESRRLAQATRSYSDGLFGANGSSMLLVKWLATSEDTEYLTEIREHECGKRR